MLFPCYLTLFSFIIYSFFILHTNSFDLSQDVLVHPHDLDSTNYQTIRATVTPLLPYSLLVCGGNNSFSGYDCSSTDINYVVSVLSTGFAALVAWVPIDKYSAFMRGPSNTNPNQDAKPCVLQVDISSPCTVKQFTAKDPAHFIVVYTINTQVNIQLDITTSEHIVTTSSILDQVVSLTLTFIFLIAFIACCSYGIKRGWWCRVRNGRWFIISSYSYAYRNVSASVLLLPPVSPTYITPTVVVQTPPVNPVYYQPPAPVYSNPLPPVYRY